MRFNSTFGRVLAVVASAVLLVGVGVSADAAPAAVVQPSPNTVGHAELKDGAVWQTDIAPAVFTVLGTNYNNSVPTGALVAEAVTKPKLSADVQAELANGSGSVLASIEPTTVVNIGGPFASKATELGTFVLPKGTWLVNTSAFFERFAAGAAGTRPQLALRYGSGSDAGTILGTEISPTANRELSASTVKIVAVSADTTVTVWAHGYNDDTSAAGSGEIKASAQISAVRVG